MDKVFLIIGTVLIDTSLQSGTQCNVTCIAVVVTITGLATMTTEPLPSEEIFQFPILAAMNKSQDADIKSSTRVMLRLQTSFSCMDVSHCLKIRWQFHHHFTQSFCACRSQKHTKTLTTWPNSYDFGSYACKSFK